VAPGLTIEGGSVNGSICYEGRTTRVRVWFENEWWYSHREYTALEILLVRAFYTLSRREGYKSLLTHASAVAKDRLGYMFLGPSESGKATVASLPFDGKTLLHDDVVTLHVDGENIYIQGSPFHTRLSVVDTELMVPLVMIFFLERSKRLSIQPLRPSDAYMLMLKQILLPLSFDPIALQMDYARMNTIWDLVKRLVNTIPAYMMEFSLESRQKIWSSIENLEIAELHNPVEDVAG
jgi:hypothetical protein